MEASNFFIQVATVLAAVVAIGYLSLYLIRFVIDTGCRRRTEAARIAEAVAKDLAGYKKNELSEKEAEKLR